MKHVILISLFFVVSAQAKTKIDVTQIQNKTAAGPCNIVESWKKDIEENFKQQLINALTNSGNFNVVEAELARGEQRARAYQSGVSNLHTTSTFKAAHFSVSGSLKTFDSCDDKNASVILEIRVLDVKKGQVAHTFVSKGQGKSKGRTSSDYKGATFNTGVFKDSPIGQATTRAIADATDKLKKAFPKREIASDDYKIRTFRRSR